MSQHHIKLLRVIR